MFYFISFVILSFVNAVNFTHKIDSSWNGGHCYKFFIKNSTDNEYRGWLIEFEYDNDIKINNLWNGKYNCQNGKCKITGLDWNDPIRKKQEFEVGYCASSNNYPKNVIFYANNNDSTQGNQSSNQSNQLNQSNNNLQNYNLEKEGLNVSIETTSSWQDGYCRKILLKNIGNKPIINWQLSFELSTDIDGWSANYQKQGNKYIVTPLSWNQRINVNTTYDIGYCVRKSINKDYNWNIDNVILGDNQNNQSSQNNQNQNNQNNQNNIGDTNNQMTTLNINDFNIKPVGELLLKYSSNKWATAKLDNVILEINPWNILRADGDAYMYYDKMSGIMTYIQDFKNIKQENPAGWVLGYPEIYVGNKPWNGNYVDGGSKLPAKVSDIKSLKVKAKWNVEHPSNLPINVALEGWITRNQFESKGVGQGEVELMIMFYRNILGPAGSKVGEKTVKIKVNGQEKDIKFDVYKANIGWDFVTYTPVNPNDFKNVEVEFDFIEFLVDSKKYLNNIDNMYFQVLELGSEYGSPNTTEARFAFQVLKYEVLGELVDKSDTEKKYIPFDFEKNRDILINSKLTYPDEKTVVASGNSFKGYLSEYFYSDDKGKIYFVITGNTLRNELRHLINWKLNDKELNVLVFKVNLQNTVVPYTFMQILSYEDLYNQKPLLRLVQDRGNIKAFIRENFNDTSAISYDIGSINQEDSFYIVAGENILYIYVNNKLVLQKQINNWNYNNYFKLGIYNHNNQSLNLKLSFDDIKYVVKSLDNFSQVKTGNINNVNESEYYKTGTNLVNYDRILPSTYKSQIDNFFVNLEEKYSYEELKEKLLNLEKKIDEYIQKYTDNKLMLSILYYIKEKTQSYLYKNISINYIVEKGKVYKIENGKKIEIKLFGVNWFGFETPNYVVHGLWSRNYKDMLDQIKSLGFNAIRLPFCTEVIKNPTPTSIDYYKNPDLRGLGALDIMKIIVEEANKRGIYILLDYHRIGCNYIEPLRYTSNFTEDDFIKVWIEIAKNFKNYPNVIGADLKNEPHSEGHGDSVYQNGATWGYNPKTDWNLAAERIGNAILKEAPHWLIFVEGTQFTNPEIDRSYKWGNNAWWGGNLMAAIKYPINLPDNKLVYSPHVYGPDVYNQPYFNTSDFPMNLPEIWYRHFGYLHIDYNKPVIIGEFGGKYGEHDPKDKIWQDAIISRMINHDMCSFFYWSWNPNSGDTGGILKDDWISINVAKYNNLKRLMNHCSK